MGDWQFILVSIVFVVAATYAGRAFLRQFRHSEDEAGGCASCPSNESAQPAKSRAAGAGDPAARPKL